MKVAPWIGFALLVTLGPVARAADDEGVTVSDLSETIATATADVDQAIQKAGDACASGCQGGSDCGCQPFAPLMIGADSPNAPRFANLTLQHQSMVRVADNHSPLPQDRVGFSYHMYNGARLSGDLVPPKDTLHEFELLLEKRILGGTMSLELVVPFAATVSSTQDWTPAPVSVDRAGEFGNLALNLKCLLWRHGNRSVSGGLLVEAPTSDDLTVVVPGFTHTLHTDTWYLTPYLAALITPNDRWYLQAFCSYRATTRANDLTINGGFVQKLRDQDMLMVDGGLGYWLYRNEDARWVKGFVPTVELHYTTTTTDAQGMSGLLNPRADYLSLTAGATAMIGDNKTLALGCVVPLQTGEVPPIGNTDRLFDWELALQFNAMW